MKQKKSQKDEPTRNLFPISKKDKIIVVIFLMIMLFIWAVPVYSVIHNSLKVRGWSNYIYVLTNKVNNVPFYQYFLNSGLNAVCASTLLVLTCSLAGFAFSKVRFVGSRIIYNFVIICLAISGPILIIPLFYIYTNLKLYNTNAAVFLSETLITIPFGVLMMKNYFDRLPKELMESAKVDGANVIQSFRMIYFPLAKPAVMNLAILQIMWSFQDFLFPLMFLTKDERFTTTVAVNSFKGAYGMSAQSLGRYNAALVLISIPTIVVFVIAQKYIVNGITSGAVKE